MRQYAAFISYSHADTATVRWLHQKIETYRLPRALVGTDSAFGPVPRRLPPVFRDRDELPASGDLGQELRAALAAARCLIVVCSPRGARSRWVNEEVLSFKRLHGEGRVLALIVAGEPGDPATECFPPALRWRIGADGALSDVPAEPIASDVRPGKDGRRLAALKLIAALADVRLDSLVRRDVARRQRRLMWITAASVAVALVTVGLAVYAEGQRRVAERQRRLADRSLEFLIGTFNIANPATENPRTITALTVLTRASRGARAELADEPAVGARLLRATGEIYANLGLPREAERDLRAALARLPASGEQRALTELRLVRVAFDRGDAAAARRAIAAAAAAVPPRARYAAALTASLVEARGQANVLSGDYAAAVRDLAEAARRREALDGDQREALGGVWMNEAITLVRLHRYAEADPLFSRAVATYAAKFGVDHVLTARALQNRAFADFENGHVAAAQRRMAQVLRIYDHVLEQDHPTVAAARILMGRIRTANRDYDGAVGDLDRAAAIYRRLYGPAAPAVGDANFYAAEAESGAGRTNAALRRVDATRSIYDSAYAATDPDQVELRLLRARVLAGGGRVAAAAAACDDALALQRRIDPADTALATARAGCVPGK
ncbi:toll/interleukin-1 receptor domain-containing protein [Sphingomonas yunnanensis]|uniref:toll/interleukin-1 receptor domain-containing protein n=1 Tax=Sphingomonas yunnanensis TaxID=310400 RepID=UPI001CA6FE38|nr:toll/interleukin-1 receptor domain-containing protein [Sphingomonas yunnanensis]MBY9064284.1 toll/interleukin-1 receptor domain-containing protein [Sphingomonas yunnanensis]